MTLSRREFLKSSAAASAAAAIGMNVPTSVQAKANEAEGGWRWDKAACRFCGTGCGIMLATKGGKIVAVKGDPAAPVNRGLNCIKGYFNAKIMYGSDRLKQPLLRVGPDGKFDKNGNIIDRKCHHEKAQRGDKTGTQGLKRVNRSKIPFDLTLELYGLIKYGVK